MQMINAFLTLFSQDTFCIDRILVYVSLMKT